MSNTDSKNDFWRDLVERTIDALQRANQGADLAAATAIIENFLREAAA